MSINLTINGVAYPFPVQGDSPPWGSQVTAWAQAVTGGMLQKAGGTFTLTADTDFGGSYGLKALKFSTRTANPASSGLVRVANNEAGIAWRDAANLNNLVLKVNASDQLEFNGVPIGGAAAYTADRAIVSNGSGQLTASTTTATEIGYVNGVTSPIQTQLDGKQATGSYITALTGDVTATGPGSVAATIANLAVTTGKINDLAVTTGKLDNLAVTAGKIANDTITNTQVNSAAAIAVSKLAALTASRAVVTDASGFISAATTTAAQIGYLSTTTSDVQVQLDAKLATATAQSDYVRLLARSSGFVTVGGTAVETDLISYSVPGNTLGTNRRIGIKAIGSWSHDGTNSATVRLKYGSTVLAECTVVVGGATTGGNMVIEADIRAVNDTAIQQGNIVVIQGQGTDIQVVTADQDGGTEDSTTAKTLSVTWEWGTGDASDTVSVATDIYLY